MKLLSKLRSKKGFTMAEILIVVSIIGILLAVAMPDVLGYYRDLKLTEYDDNARTIFVAAQSRLSGLVAMGEKLDDIGDKPTTYGTAPAVQYRYVLHDPKNTASEDSLHKILPGGSVDPALQDDKYVIEFDPSTGAVYAVWFWKEDNSNFNYGNHAYQADGVQYPNEDSSVTTKDTGKKARRPYMVGYYGGTSINRLKVNQMPIPEVEVINAEELVLTIKLPADGLDNVVADVTLSSGGKSVEIIKKGTFTKNGGYYSGRVALDTLKESSYSKVDDLSAGVGKKFKNWVTTISGGVPAITPGSDIKIEVKVYTNGTGADALIPQRVSCDGVNSLFQSITANSDGSYTANIAYGRHLQNLHQGAASSTGPVSGVKNVTKAIQTKDINFTLKNQSGNVSEDIYYWASTYPDTTEDPTKQDQILDFHPINNNELTGYNGEYDGTKFEIRNMGAGHYEFGGLFSYIKSGTYENITLVNPHVHAEGTISDVDDPAKTDRITAGALVGYIAGNVEIKNCNVYNELDEIKDKGNKVNKLFDSGFDLDNLIMYYNSSIVKPGDPDWNTYKQDLYVERLQGLPHIGAPASGSFSGGLVGNVGTDGSVTIENCSVSVINIGAKCVGGMVGYAEGNVTIENSYAASYVYGNRDVAGLIGLAEKAVKISNSYAAGEVVSGYDKGFKGAGLLHYDGEAKATVKPDKITVKNCYSAVRYNGDGVDGLPRLDDQENRTSFQVVGYIYGTFKGDNGNLYVKQNGISYGYDVQGKAPSSGHGGSFITTKGDPSDCGTAITTAELTKKVTEGFGGADSPWNTGSGVANALADTHAYTLLTETKELGDKVYPYPMLNSMPHYGDWLEEDAATFALVNWEKYDTTIASYEYGVYGSFPNDGPASSATPINTLLNPGSDRTGKNYAVADGYGVIVQQDAAGATTVPTVVIDGVTDPITFTDPDSIIKNITIGSATYDLYVLPYTVPTAAPTAYYTEINVNGKVFYYNPDFACEVFEKGADVPAAPQAKEDVDGESGDDDVLDNGVVIRTARQLANLATYTNTTGSAATGWSYHQFLDIDFAKYEAVVSGQDDGHKLTPATFGGTYNGNNFKIVNLYLGTSGSGDTVSGLFATVENGAAGTPALQNITLVNVKTGNANVAAGLVANLKSATVKNCGIYVDGSFLNPTKDDATAYTTFTVEGTDIVGGLVGKVEGTSALEKSFAAVQVSGGTTAGGLVGQFAGTATVTSCYAGGHTVSGAYDKNAPNVTGTTVGGFAGEIAAGATVTFSDINYSTCSVGKGTDMGLFIGKNESTSIPAPSGDDAIYATGTAFNADGTQATATAESYLTTGNAIPRGSLTADDTYPYDTTLALLAYPYDTNLDEHHGDWVTFPMAAYIEKYSDNSYSAYAASVNADNKVEVALNTLKSQAALGTTDHVIDDFYRVLSTQMLPTGTTFTLDRTHTGTLELDVDNFGTDGKTEFDKQEYYVYKFDTGWTPTIGVDYYHALTLGNYTFYINPDFGLEAYAAASATTLTKPFSKPEAAGKKDGTVATLDDLTTGKDATGVVIRSARQLANIQAYTNNATTAISDAAKTWTYDQLLNVDFDPTTGYNGAGLTLGMDNTHRLAPANLTGTGSYHGHQKEIKNLYIGVGTTAGDGAGLFATVGSDGTLDGVRLVNVSVDGGTATATGGLVGIAYGNVNDCGIYVSEAGNYEKFTVSGSGANGVGGLIGQVNGGTVTKSFAAVKVEGTAAAVTAPATPINSVGGFVGQFSDGNIENCYAGGYVNADKKYEYATVNVKGDNNVGGFVGSVTNTISTVTFTGINYATASVGGTDTANVGLFAGAGAITKPTGPDDKLYAVAKAFKTGTTTTVVAPRDESAYLVSVPAATTTTTVTTTVPYNQTGAYPYESGQTTHHGDWIEFEVMGLYYDTVDGTTGYYANGAVIDGHPFGSGAVATDDGYRFLTAEDLGEIHIALGGKSYQLTESSLSPAISIDGTTYNFQYEVPAGALNAPAEHYYATVSIYGKMFYANFGFAGEIFDKVDDLNTPMEKVGLAAGSDETVVIRTARQLANLGIRSNMGKYNTSNTKVYTPAAQAIQAAKIGQALDIDYSGYPKMPTAATLPDSNANANHTPITLGGGSYDGHDHEIRNLVPGMIRLAIPKSGSTDISEVQIQSGLFGRVTGGEIKDVTLVNATVDNSAQAAVAASTGTTSGGGTGGTTGKWDPAGDITHTLKDENAGTNGVEGWGSTGNINAGTKRESKDGKYFTMYWGKAGEFKSNSGEFADGTKTNRRAKFGGGIGTENYVSFTTNNPATVKVYWEANVDNQSIEAHKDTYNGSEKFTDGNSYNKGEKPIFEVELEESGTYFVGSNSSGVYIYVVKVIEHTKENTTTPGPTTPTDPSEDNFPTGTKADDYKVRFGALVGAVNPADKTNTECVKIENCGVYVEPVGNTDAVAYNNAYNTYKISDGTDASADTVGGLIGMATQGTTIEKCYAAVKVEGNIAAGGFAGHLKDVAIKNSYSGGHTVEGAYSITDYNVTAKNESKGSAGGFTGILQSTGTDTLTFDGVCYSTASAQGGHSVGNFAGTIPAETIGWDGFGDASVYGIGIMDGPNRTDERIYLDATVPMRAFSYSTKPKAAPYDVNVLDGTTGSTYPYEVPKDLATEWVHHGDWPMRYNIVYYELYTDEGSDFTDSNNVTLKNRVLALDQGDEISGQKYIGFYGVFPAGSGSTGYKVVNTLRVDGYVYKSGYMLVSDAEVDKMRLDIHSYYADSTERKAKGKENTGVEKDDGYYDDPNVVQPTHTTVAETTQRLDFEGYEIKNKDDGGTTLATDLLGNYGYILPDTILNVAASQHFYMDTQINGQTYLFNPQFPYEAVNVGIEAQNPKTNKYEIDYETIRPKYGINYVTYDENGKSTLHTYSDNEAIKNTLIIRSALSLAGMARYSRPNNNGLVKTEILNYHFEQHMDVDYSRYAPNVLYDGCPHNRDNEKDDPLGKDQKTYYYHAGQDKAFGQVPAMLDEKGSYYGFNHTISNLHLSNDSGDAYYAGLFGKLGGTVTDLKLENIYVTSEGIGKDDKADDANGSINVGGLAAVVTDTARISNVSIDGVTIELKDFNEKTEKGSTTYSQKVTYGGVGGAIGKIMSEVGTTASTEPTVKNVIVTDPTIQVNARYSKKLAVGGVIGSADGTYSTYTSDATTDDTRPVKIIESGVYMSETNKSKFDTMGVNVSGSSLSGDEVGGFAGFLGKGVYLSENKEPDPTDPAVPKPERTGVFAAIRVQGESLVGGFAGHIQGAHVENCYSGGHTESGKYDTTNYNVVANDGTAGGFAGKIEVAFETGSSGPMAMFMTGVNYSTSSVSGSKMGKFAGEFDGAEALNAKMGDMTPVNYAGGEASGTARAESTVNTGAGMPRQKHDAAFKTLPYDDTLTDAFPYQSNLTVHHGDWTETGLVGAGYWQVENDKLMVWYVANDGTKNTLHETGSKDFNHDGRDHMAITDSGYFTVAQSGTFDGVSGETLAETDITGRIKTLFGEDKLTVVAYQLHNGKADVQTWTCGDASFYVNPAYAEAVELKAADMTASTMGKSADTAYKIRTVQQLTNMGGVTSGTYFKQDHDIVGDNTSATSFGGDFNGAEYRIIDAKAPVFDTLADNANIHNVIVYAPQGNGSISGNGGIANSTSGKVEISNTIVAGFTINASGTSVGGLVGEVTGGELTIKNSEATNKLSGANAGGLVGNVTAGTLTIEQSYAGGTVTGTTSAGGLVGAAATADNVTYENVYSYATVNGATTTYGIGPGTVDPSSVIQEYWDDGIPSGKTASDGEGIKGVGMAQIQFDTRQFNCAVEECLVPDATDGLKNLAQGKSTDDEKYSVFPFAAFVTDGAASGAKNYHYGEVPKAQFVGLFYWEKEIIKYADGRPDKTEYHYYAHGGEIVDGTLYGQKVLLDSLCYDHHLNGERASIVESGYGVFNTDSRSTFTLKKGTASVDLSTLTKIDGEVKNGLIRDLWPNDEVTDAQVFELPSSTGDAIDEWTLGGVDLGKPIKAYPAFAAAIDQDFGDDNTGSGSYHGMGSIVGKKPLQIRTIDQLMNLTNMKADDYTKYVAISHDIDGKGKTLEPISSEQMMLFDGFGYRILDLDIKPSTGEAALFSSLKSGCEIKNVILYSTNGKGEITSTDSNAAGILASGQKVKIENCVVVGYTITGAKSIGGIVGDGTNSNGSNESYIRNCQAVVTLDGTNGATNIGGIAGKFRGKNDSSGTVYNGIVDCYAGGKIINAKSDTTVGGLAGGMNNGLDIKDSYSYMNLANTGATATNVYAIGKDGTITDCYYLSEYATGATVQGTGKTFTEMCAMQGDDSAKYVYVPNATDAVDGLTSWGAGAYPFAAKVTVNVRAGVDTGEETGTVTVHYGDWPYSARAAGIAYWEKDADGNYYFNAMWLDHKGDVQTYDKDTFCTDHHVNSATGAIEERDEIEDSGYVFFTTNKDLTLGELSVNIDSTLLSGTDRSAIIDALNEKLKVKCLDDDTVVSSNGKFTTENPGTVDAYRTVTLTKIDGSTEEKTFYCNPGMSGVAEKQFGDKYEKQKDSTGKEVEVVTPSNLYIEIRTVKQMDNIPNDVVKGYHFQQTHDIYGKDYGSASNPKYTGAAEFAGTYDGQGYKILDLSMSGADKDVGLFASISSYTCELRNIIMYAPNGATISGTKTKGKDPTDDHYGVGGLVGSISSGSTGTAAKIENCVVAGYTIKGEQYVGGLIGWGFHGANIKNCAAVNDIECTTIAATTKNENGANHCGAGGILGGYGSNSAGKTEITSCYTGGTIKVDGDNASNAIVGGIAGADGSTNSHALVKNCYTYVDLSGCASAKASVISSSENSDNANNYYLNDSARIPNWVHKQGEGKAYDDLKALNIAGFGAATKSYVTKNKSVGGTTSDDGLKDRGNVFPFPEVVRKVTGYGSDGNPIYGDYVHYGEWPAKNSSPTPSSYPWNDGKIGVILGYSNDNTFGTDSDVVAMMFNNDGTNSVLGTTSGTEIDNYIGLVIGDVPTGQNANLRNHLRVLYYSSKSGKYDISTDGKTLTIKGSCTAIYTFNSEKPVTAFTNKSDFGDYTLYGASTTTNITNGSDALLVLVYDSGVDANTLKISMDNIIGWVKVKELDGKKTTGAAGSPGAWDGPSFEAAALPPADPFPLKLKRDKAGE